MRLVPIQKFVIRSPLDKKTINEILANSIGVEGPETKRKFVSGNVKNDYFQIRVEAKNWSDIKGYLTLRGKILENKEGCKLEVNIGLEMFPVILALIIIFGSLSIFYLVKGLLAHNFGSETFSIIFVILIYFFIMLDFNSEAYATKEELLRLTKATA
jgi:hypothetical protein